MGMMDLCDPQGDSALRDGGFQNRFFRSLNLIYLRFSDKPANGFLLNNLTSRFQETAGHFLWKLKPYTYI